MCQNAAKPHTDVILINNMSRSKHASIAQVLELIVNAPVVLKAFGSASIPHARHVTCIAALQRSQLHCGHVVILMK